MLIDAVVINLTRNGFDKSPSYSLTIRGIGTIEYNGLKNVKVIDRIKEEFDKEKIILLLTEFKNLGFFTIQDVYYVDVNAGRPFTTISISIPGSDGQMKTKILSHYQDEDVPKELIKIEDKIDEVTNSEKWVKKPPEPKKEPVLEEKKEAPSIQKEEIKKPSSSKIDEARKFMDRMERVR